MPIYEYQCPECATIFEEWAKASEMKDLAPCPLCQTPSERIISHTAFVLKGGGWYVTDYGYRKNISEDSAAAGAAGSAAPVSPAAATPTEGSSTSSSQASPASSSQASPAPKADSPSAATSGTSPAAGTKAPASSTGTKPAA